MDEGTSIIPSAFVAKLPALRHVTVRLLVVYGRYMNFETNECWPSLETLKKRAGIKSKKSLNMAIRELEDSEIINRYPRPRTRQSGNRKGGWEVVTRWSHSVGPNSRPTDSKEAGLRNAPVEEGAVGLKNDNDRSKEYAAVGPKNRPQTPNRTPQGNNMSGPEAPPIISASLIRKLPKLSEGEKNVWIQFSQLHNATVGNVYEPHKTDFDDVRELIGRASVEDLLKCLELFPNYLKGAKSKTVKITFCIRAFCYACGDKGHLLDIVQKELERKEEDHRQVEKESTAEYWKDSLNWVLGKRENHVRTYGRDEDPKGTLSFRPGEHLYYREAVALCEQKLAEIEKATRLDQ